VGAANDPTALGALRAFQEAGRANDCAIVGNNA
jgi:ribose transport system substrate-binding protein